MKTLARFTVLLTAVFAPTLAFAQNVIGGVGGGGWFLGIGGGGGFGAIGIGCGVNTICIVAAQIIWMINYVLVPLVFAVAFIVFLWGVFKAYIWHRGEEQVEIGHQLIIWGVLGFVIMISIWGLVNVVSNTFGLGGIGAPPTPTSYPAY